MPPTGATTAACYLVQSDEKTATEVMMMIMLNVKMMIMIMMLMLIMAVAINSSNPINPCPRKREVYHFTTRHQLLLMCLKDAAKATVQQQQQQQQHKKHSRPQQSQKKQQNKQTSSSTKDHDKTASIHKTITPPAPPIAFSQKFPTMLSHLHLHILNTFISAHAMANKERSSDTTSS